MAAKALPSREVLRQLLDYDPETGTLTWKARGPEWFTAGRHSAAHSSAKWNSKYAGKSAFTALTTGYQYGSVFGKLFLAHRVIWKMVHGTEPDHIDHINGVRTDNRITNLRDVNATGNARNNCLPSHNTSGSMGISRDKARGKWAAYITLADKKVSLGRFDCISQAVEARKEAERRHGFHENHGRAA